ncbi:hypothetical protein MBM_01368 [Drepanopeziza brunnea f. sp. 'multigermtubi' MB_m1]|uniref:Uncharacterized protein n=1 Tax=Marssonina brunnea f. sp. multigermtubi (strain MB_m1) TaxID=1072389 RepID=K1X6H5_MARBU|nr:uncharacterized protein MBM_01368 [Drepanopeziza brunnea f. sp. 'multigermtubi' MB_m1]EKD20686.1 hypothetical protein MBM_01368 [Drepanopeziza brunnea f. sp. 'multigermtubi' MB_m1]
MAHQDKSNRQSEEQNEKVLETPVSSHRCLRKRMAEKLTRYTRPGQEGWTSLDIFERTTSGTRSPAGQMPSIEAVMGMPPRAHRGPVAGVLVRCTMSLHPHSHTWGTRQDSVMAATRKEEGKRHRIFTMPSEDQCYLTGHVAVCPSSLTMSPMSLVHRAL